MKIYLASPFFNQTQRENVEKIARRLRNMGNYVYVPMEHKIPNALDMPNYAWANEVFIEDLVAIDYADVVYAITYGMEDDAGTAWEIGYSYAKDKDIVLIPMNGTDATYSLMAYQSASNVVNPDTLREIDPRTITQS